MPIQNIEGSRPVINKVLALLVSEYAHFLLHIVNVEEIEVRKWDGFLIKYLTSSSQDKEYIINSLSENDEFNPYLMKKDQIVSLMESIFEEDRSC